MEAASTAARAATRFRFPWWESVRAWVGKYGLIVVLLALPVRYVIGDLVTKGSLVSLGNIFVAGISNGAIWALVALGYTLVYGIIELINFAHGDVFMIGSLTAVGFWGTIGLSLATGTAGLVFGLLLGLWGTYHYFRNERVSGGFRSTYLIMTGITPVQGLLGLSALLLGGHPTQGLLHMVYGIFATLFLPGAYLYSRTGNARREALVLAGASWIVSIAFFRGIATG